MTDKELDNKSIVLIQRKIREYLAKKNLREKYVGRVIEEQEKYSIVDPYKIININLNNEIESQIKNLEKSEIEELYKIFENNIHNFFIKFAELTNQCSISNYFYVPLIDKKYNDEYFVDLFVYLYKIYGMLAKQKIDAISEIKKIEDDIDKKIIKSHTGTDIQLSELNSIVDETNKSLGYIKNKFRSVLELDVESSDIRKDIIQSKITNYKIITKNQIAECLTNKKKCHYSCFIYLW